MGLKKYLIFRQIFFNIPRNMHGTNNKKIFPNLLNKVSFRRSYNSKQNCLNIKILKKSRA